ncbi:hypothetical protein [Thiomicrorhabdus lithotrophica]|uniref:Uncharacterized protein n=1 Tax=Thiomicrorhabdus lithotrophica TaxID=2949997 RepID=A0ABY8CGQ1_9GAMM|nr:hypothetical protein [Thiomicrorhabdus lithotrophica]WEJ63628.1 hypothetical protein NR989_05070 [Thiomicrorhabdus lithotrophica]
MLEPVFLQVVNAAQLLGEATKLISQGRNPLLNEKLSQEIMKNLKTVGCITSLEVAAPKTFQYFSQLEKN